jgi:predicted site-specific integrase-resolvase
MKKKTEEETWLSMKEAAAFLGLPYATFYGWNRRGLIVGKKIGKKTVFSEKDLKSVSIIEIRCRIKEEASDRIARRMKESDLKEKINEYRKTAKKMKALSKIILDRAKELKLEQEILKIQDRMPNDKESQEKLKKIVDDFLGNLLSLMHG